MSYNDQTNNLPKTNFLTENKSVNNSNELFRTYMVQLPLDQFKSKQKEIKELCQWSRAVWYNKFHGITPLAPLEIKAIAKILQINEETLINQ